ncbi:sodium/bile acid cotransporter 7 [Comamonas odontotermitis]|uniref:Sodium/bile acid cotransporter 7 n=1 Tax=Comamonas odontotermitis TaxID=379895 RepID=A0ABR6RJK9_9BURK|nr:bile acid:sodium symporter family protein [Comamonas odontotermitis]MBB6579346.1 sodium/bile acid cotransporter 7 [Comamonas odontotermitis]
MKFRPDNFTLMLVAVVLLASFLPATGDVASVLEKVTTAAVALLFFLHGAKLSRKAVLDGIMHWRLHLFIVLSTFALFPLLGWLLKPVLTPLVSPQIYVGVMFLCVLPSTVQSSIAFVSMARGNIPAAICSASASTLLGVFITPLLVSIFVTEHGASGSFVDAVVKILLQLMLPFALGHLLQRWVGPFIKAHGKLTKVVDQGSILLVVYTAFSAAVVQGIWRQVSVGTLVGLLVICATILALALFLTTFLSRRLGFDKEDEITAVFCGSKKSLVSGVPMAKVLFASSTVGMMVLPLMLFHQMQLMVCAVLAARYAKRAELIEGEAVAASAAK